MQGRSVEGFGVVASAFAERLAEGTSSKVLPKFVGATQVGRKGRKLP